MGSLPSPDGRRRLHRDERRDQLLDSAAALLVARGVASITMEGVAAEAGVSKALPYAHFDNATELLRSLRDRELDRLRDRIIETSGPAAGIEATVASATRAYFQVIEERGAVLVAALRGLPLDDAENARRRNPTFFVDLFERELGLPEGVARTVSSVFVTGIDGAVSQWVAGRVPRDQAEATFVTLVIGGVLAVAERERARERAQGPT
jgi:AcrR family transcriptional regulator